MKKRESLTNYARRAANYNTHKPASCLQVTSMRHGCQLADWHRSDWPPCIANRLFFGFFLRHLLSLFSLPLVFYLRVKSALIRCCYLCAFFFFFNTFFVVLFFSIFFWLFGLGAMTVRNSRIQLYGHCTCISLSLTLDVGFFAKFDKPRLHQWCSPIIMIMEQLWADNWGTFK